MFKFVIFISLFMYFYLSTSLVEGKISNIRNTQKGEKYKVPKKQKFSNEKGKKYGKENEYVNKKLYLKRKIKDLRAKFDKEVKKKTKIKLSPKKKMYNNKKQTQDNKLNKNIAKKGLPKTNNGKQKNDKEERNYYTEGGKYRESRKFDIWAAELRSMWSKTKTDSSCTCGVSGEMARKGSGRIVNGEEASINKYPWIIAMMDGGGFYYCGGSVVNNQWILTAAHCVYGSPNNPAKDMFVRVGDHHIPKDGETKHVDTLKVERFIVHQNYDEVSTNNDIALLKLEKKIDFSKYGGTVAPVCLPELPRKYYGDRVTVSGWGLLEDEGKQSEVLMEVDLEVQWMRACREDFSYKKDWITPKMMCTFKKDHDACQGDSGGPLIKFNESRDRYEQVGVVSWGIGCASSEYPGIFVKVSHYLRWIMKKTTSATWCSG